MKKPVRVVALCYAALVAVLLGFDSARAAPIEFTRFDVSVDLNVDGTLHVTETLTLAFNWGPHEHWLRQVPSGRMDAIRNVTVREETFTSTPYLYRDAPSENLAPGTFSWQTADDAVRIWWRFEPVTSAQRVFVVEYDVVGALRTYPETTPPTQQIWWTAVDPVLLSSAPVKLATIAIWLPYPVELAAVGVGRNGRDPVQDYSRDGQHFGWERSALSADDNFEVRLAFPPIIAGIEPPAWQAADDALDARERSEQEARENRRALLDLIFLAAGLVLVSAGGVGLYGAWYLRGRDPHVWLAAEMLPHPPDDLPPGAAGVLLDERADHEDMIATFVDLARRGVLSVRPVLVSTGPLSPHRRDFELTLVQPDAVVAPFEGALLRALFGPDPTKPWQPKLGEIRYRFADSSPRIKELLYAELVERGYFSRSPEQTRARWRGAAYIGLAVSIGGGAALGFGFGGLAWFPAAVAPGFPLLALGLSRSMPRKTRKGAEAAARWRAFRHHLASLGQYGQISDAAQIVDRYLPYAVAFKLNRSWADAFAPSERGTLIHSGRLRGRDAGLVDWGVTSGDWSLGDLPIASLGELDLQYASDLMASAIQASGDGLFGLLDAAANAFEGFDFDID